MKRTDKQINEALEIALYVLDPRSHRAWGGRECHAASVRAADTLKEFLRQRAPDVVERMEKEDKEAIERAAHHRIEEAKRVLGLSGAMIVPNTIPGGITWVE